MTAREGWVADPTIGWRILLTATLPQPPQLEVVSERLAALGADQGWPSPLVRSGGSAAAVAGDLVAPDPAPLLAGIAGHDLVLSAHHGSVDGLGLLRVLEQVTRTPVTSSARGVGDRPAAHGYAGTVARRLAEAAFRPPARVPEEPPQRPGDGDVMVELEVAGSVRTAALVHAAARAVVDHGAVRRVAVAVGATRDPAQGAVIEDRSALLRLRDVEQLDLAGVERALRTTPVERPPVAPVRRPWTPALERVTATGMRVLARRLGSTLLVSHLGEVTAPHVDRLVFHPVTAGGTGISLGAVGHHGRTVLTLRARAALWHADGLERLLEAVRGRLV